MSQEKSRRGAGLWVWPYGHEGSVHLLVRRGSLPVLRGSPLASLLLVGLRSRVLRSRVLLLRVVRRSAHLLHRTPPSVCTSDCSKPTTNGSTVRRRLSEQECKTETEPPAPYRNKGRPFVATKKSAGPGRAGRCGFPRTVLGEVQLMLKERGNVTRVSSSSKMNTVRSRTSFANTCVSGISARHGAGKLGVAGSIPICARTIASWYCSVSLLTEENDTPLFAVHSWYRTRTDTSLSVRQSGTRSQSVKNFLKVLSETSSRSTSGWS